MTKQLDCTVQVGDLIKVLPTNTRNKILFVTSIKAVDSPTSGESVEIVYVQSSSGKRTFYEYGWMLTSGHFKLISRLNSKTVVEDA